MTSSSTRDHLRVLLDYERGILPINDFIELPSWSGTPHQLSALTNEGVKALLHEAEAKVDQVRLQMKLKADSDPEWSRSARQVKLLLGNQYNTLNVEWCKRKVEQALDSYFVQVAREELSYDTFAIYL